MVTTVQLRYSSEIHTLAYKKPMWPLGEYTMYVVIAMAGMPMIIHSRRRPQRSGVRSEIRPIIGSVTMSNTRPTNRIQPISASDRPRSVV